METINIKYLTNTSNDKKIIKSQSTTNIDKDFYLEVFSNGKNKLMWRNKFINYVKDDVKDFLLTPSNEEAVFKFYKQIKSKPLIDIKYIEEKKPTWKITPQELKYNRRSLNSYTLPRCNGFTKDPRSTGRCNLGGTNEMKVPLKWKGNITNIVGRFGLEFKHFCKYHEGQFNTEEKIDNFYARLGYIERNGYICKVCKLPEAC